MIFLADTDENLEIETSNAQSLDAFLAWADVTTSTLVGGSSSANIASATTTVVMAAPAAATQRQLKYASFFNRGTGSQTVRLKYDKAGTERYITALIPLDVGESIQYVQDKGISVLDAVGRTRTDSIVNNGLTGRNIPFFKIGTVAEAIGVIYNFSKDTGLPGAWDVGTPGLNGRVTDGMSAGDAGCLPLWTPTGSLYITKFDIVSSVAGMFQLPDIMWVNTGLVVTTTTAQAITPVALPARDLDGTTNGKGVEAGLLVTTATTNSGAVINCTISYTNYSGTVGRTGTMSSFPATAVIGSLIPFQLQAGDIGVRSVQSVTLGTSLVTGAVSLVLYRRLATQSVSLANTPPQPGPDSNPGTRLYNGACLLPMVIPSATAAMNISGSIQVMER